jgi:hypothetical protein
MFIGFFALMLCAAAYGSIERWVRSRFGHTKVVKRGGTARNARIAKACSPSRQTPLQFNPSTGNPVLDLVPESERRDAVRAQSLLDSDAEKYARALCELLADFRSQSEQEKYRRGTEVARIGKELNNDQGFERMRLVYLRVKALGGDARLLEMGWHGIGQWLG